MDMQNVAAKMIARRRRRRRMALVKLNQSPITAGLTGSRDRLTAEMIARELVETAEALPIVSRLTALFTNPKMFDAYARFSDEGFRLAEHAEHKIMAGSHRDVPGYMFKKYNNDKPGKKQLLNYMRRIEGARLLRSFIAAHGFSRVVAPRKWLYALTSDFQERYLVVAEKLDLVSSDDTKHNYERIDKEQLRELATVLYYFRGLNSTTANLPFTEDGKIAFIDTERWANGKDFLRKIGDRMPSDRSKLAEEIYSELLGKGEQPLRSAFKRAPREADFEREEDTSSSSS